MVYSLRLSRYRRARAIVRRGAMRRIVLSLAIAVATCATFAVSTGNAAGGAARDNAVKDRQEALKQANKAATNFRQIMGISDEEKKIPRNLLSDAECVAVFPDVVTAAFIF